MNLHTNMEFEIKNSFVPNLSNSDTLRIVEVSKESVVVQMQNSSSRAVFPLDSFKYLIRKSSLVRLNEYEEQEQTS
jgi:hypothetical protein